MNMRWFDRKFLSDSPAAMFPNLVERLRATPARLEELIRVIPAEIVTARKDGTWSIQENAGHLLDLEPLWMARIRDIEVGNSVLTVADLENRRTWERKHNEVPFENILK